MVRIDNLANGVCASYKNIGLLVYRENKLFLLLGWSCCDDEPTSGRQVLLEFSPALPSNIEVLEIISSDSGRYIALICESGVFIVTVGNELCQILGVANSRSVIERVHNHYFVKCNELSPLMFSGRHARKVVKLRWFHTEADKHLLAVLSDDSVVRIHDLRGEGDFKVTTLRVDFASVIRDEFAEPEPESRTSKFFGLRKTIVSFDFGLTIHNSNTDTNLYTVFAIDSDATIHYAVFNTETYQCLGPTGPLRLRYTMSSSQMLGCDAVDMKYIRHWYSDVAPIIAVASGKGMIYHLMLAQTTAEFDECEFDYGSFYEAYLCDVYKFDVARGKGDTVLSQDSSVSSKYFIRSSRAVASLNLSTWLSDISKIGNRESQSRPNPPTLNYAAVQVPDAASKDNFVSASSLQLMDDGEVPEDNKTVLCRRFVIFATTKSGKTYSKVVSELVIPERKEEPQPTVQSHNGSYGQSALRGVVSDPRVSSFREASIPLLILSDVPEAQQVTAIMAMSANLNDATARLSEASGCYKKICDDMIKEFTAIRGVEKALISKQVTLLDELSDTKARWSTIKARLQRFHRREQALETKIERLALNQPLTPAEQKMFESLKEFHSRIKKIRGTVGVISDRVNGYHGSQENFTGIEENSKMSANTYAVLQNKFALSDLQIAYGGLKRRTNRLLQQVERMEEKANELN
ncbi:hypothetical protein L596_002644 [Steinernema carpocapsae]|uniref:Uncharacterized protein n=1 Tax=Steinernema carpocapsae TaxID=34508 RepID=A0A4V6I7R6_STECR|nr:hypothetical protein L596_002644 [Steinernema carpocapsae]